MKKVGVSKEGSSSECPFKGNRFCSSLPPEDRAQLCATCRIRAFDADRFFDVSYLSKGPSLLVEGIIVMALPDAVSSKFRPQMYMAPGQLLSEGWRASESVASMGWDAETTYLCLTDASVAMFDYGTWLKLYNSSVRFLHALIGDYQASWMGLERATSAETSTDRVRRFLACCKEFDIPTPSQSRIAQACGLSRVTVNKVLGRLDSI